MRRGEILGLRWLDVDAEHGRVLLPQTKNGDGRIVYLNQTAAAVLASLPRRKATDRVFDVANAQYVRVAFERSRRRSGIEDFCFHDLRHTAASWMRMRGPTFTPSRSCSATRICGWRCATSTSHPAFLRRR